MKWYHQSTKHPLLIAFMIWDNNINVGKTHGEAKKTKPCLVG